MKFLINILMKFLNIYFFKAPLYIAVEKGQVEIVNILSSHSNIDINSKLIKK